MKKLGKEALYERETTILFNELETDCMVYTCNKKLQRQIEKLGVKPDAKDHMGRRYRFPKKWLQPPAKPKERSSRGQKKEAAPRTRGKGSDRSKGPALGRKAAGATRVPQHGDKGRGRGKDSVRPAVRKDKGRAKAVVQSNSVRGQPRRVAQGKGTAPVHKKDHLRQTRRH